MMTNLDPRQEQQLADELDALLTAHLQKRPLPPINPAVAREAKLAQALLSLATMIEPDTHFLSTLERRLKAAAQPPAAKPKGAKPSVWQQISDTIKEGFAMKRIGFAFATLLVLFGLGYAVWTFWGVTPGVGPEPVAEIPADSETAVAEIDPASLPPLPALGTSAQGRGGGGAGGGAGGGDGSMAASETISSTPMPVEMDGGIGDDVMMDDMMIMPWNPLADAVFELTIDLPTEAGSATVFDLTMGGAYSDAEAAELAQRFGFDGPLYREVYPVIEGDEMFAWTPPVSYYAFDGTRSLWIGEGYLHYSDTGADLQAGQTPMAHEQARPIAEAFLRERGLLDFEYDVEQVGGHDVVFTRQINGRSSTHGQLYVSVGPDGRVSMVSYSPLRQLAPLADYPIRSAVDAWALLQELAQEENFDFQRVFYNIYPGPDYVDPYAETDSMWADRYRYWERTYQVGQTIIIYPHLMVFEAVHDDVAPRIQADRFLLEGSTEMLRQMVGVVGRQIKVSGTIRQLGSRPVLELLDWEALPEGEYRYTYSEGITQRDGEQMFVLTDEGEQILLPDAPADLESGVRISVNGWEIETDEGPYPTFNWQSLGLTYDEPFDLPVEPMPEGDEDPFKIGQITINEVELVYVITSTYDKELQQPHFLAQPAWRFKGSTNTNMIIELTVQAVEDAYITMP